MLVEKKGTIFIFDICKDLLLDTIESKEKFYHCDFHSTNENVFFICSGTDVTLYKIDNIKIDQISIIKGHYQNTYYGCFNQFKPNIFLTVSNEGLIKIYDLINSSSISLINLEESFEFVDIIIKWGNKDIGFIKNDNIIYFEYENLKKENIKKYYSNDISDFYFLNDIDDSLIIIKSDNIEIVKNNKKLCEYKEDINSSFYFRRDKILIIINFQLIQLLKINDNNEQINHLFSFNQNKKNILYNPSFVNENFLNSNEICKFFDKKVKFCKISLYSITYNGKSEQKYIINKTNKILDIQNIKKIFSDIPILLSKNNNVYDTSEPCYNPRNKKYFEIEDIKNELNEVKKRSFLVRKELVKNYVEKQKNKKNKNENNIDINENIKEKYIHLLILLINDDTNKDLLKEYLNFLKRNDTELENIYEDYYEKFKDEFNYYFLIFDTEEIE